MSSSVDTRQFEALARRFKTLDRETQTLLRAEAKTWAPSLIHAAAAKAPGKVERGIAVSGKTTLTTRGVKATFGSGGTLRRGVPLREVTRPYEFGTYRPNTYTTYRSRQRTSKRPMKVARRTQKQIPRGRDDGRFIYPALADTTPELVARYVRALAKALTDAK